MSKDKKTYRTLSAQEIEDYLKGLLTGKDAHDLEKHALEDAFDGEALEGLEQHDTSVIASDIRKLKAKIRRKSAHDTFPWFKVAASLALVVVAIAAIWLTIEVNSQPDGNIAKNETTGTSDAGPDPVPKVAPPEVPTSREKPPVQAARSSQPEPAIAEVEVDFEEVNVPKGISDDFLVAEHTISTPLNVSPGPTSEEVDDTYDIQEAKKQALVHQRAKAEAAAVARSSGREARRIYGQVLDESGDPLPGVKVTVRGSQQGTLTDIDGNYQLNALPADATLHFSFIGYEPVETPVDNRQEVNVSMEANVSALSEVVVITDDRSEVTELSYERARPIIGMKAYSDYLRENLQYPEQAKAVGHSGNVVLKVVVSPSGDLSEITVKRSLGYGCDEEAIRLVREGPVWEPARQSGNPVESTVRVRVKFDPD